MLPSLPSALGEWAEPSAWGVITTLLAVNWLETKASEARLNKRIDDLKADMNQQIGELRTGMNQQVSELKTDMNQQIGELRTGMSQQVSELRADNRALGEKMDRVLDALLAVKQT